MSSATTVYVDLSDLLRLGVTTGIQRVVRQVLPRLAAGCDDDLELRMLRFDAVEHHYDELDSVSMLDVLAGVEEAPQVVGHRGIGDFGSTDVFLDLDSAWNSSLKRSTLYPLLRDAGVTIVSYLYDLVPLKVPEVVHDTTSANWIVYLSAVFAYSDLVMTDSRCAENDFLTLKRELAVDRHIPTLVTRLGCDLPDVPDPTADELALLEPLGDGRFVLFVGTIEPRKEHLLAVRAFDELAAQYPDVHLVFAGRKGWIKDKTVPTITEHPLFRTRLHWIEKPSDALLAELYRRATACLYLSKYEGFGLPIAEALAHGRVTLASHNSSMAEVGGDACDYTWHNLVPEVAETLGQYLGDPALLAARERHIRETFRPLSWDTVAGTIDRALRGLSRAAELCARPRSKSLQLVFISNDLGQLEQAIGLWDERSRAVKEYVVVAPCELLDGVRAIRSRVPVVAVDEFQVLVGREEEYDAASLQRRDWLLRAGLVELPEIDDVFVMLDDDHLPLAEVDVDAFISESGRMRAYYFHDLNRWAHRLTNFDLAQVASAAMLGPDGFELLSYASHQPQVVDKQLLRKAVEWADLKAGGANICAWATYFNHAATHYPTAFEKRVFRTLNWPARATDWTHAYPPEDLLFERLDPESYSTGVFKGLSVSEPAERKIERKREELAPFLRSETLFERSHRRLRRNDLMHGPIRFAADDFQLLVAGLPQLITVAEGSHLRLDVFYQLLGEAGQHQIGISYRVDGGPPVATTIRRSGDLHAYETGMASLPIVGTRPGLHDVAFFLHLDGWPVGVRGIRYLAKLVVVGPQERPATYYDQLAASG